MNREEIIKDLSNKVQENNGNYDVEELDIWVNNSDPDYDCGEDFQVVSVGYWEDTLGFYVGADDFFAVDELSDKELEEVYEQIIG